MSALLAWVTCPESEARRIANGLVESGVAACVNTLPGVTSTYLWKGAVETERESLLLIKTTQARFTELEKKVLELHPYELPEIIGVPVTLGHSPYLDWIDKCVSGPSS